MSQSVQLGENIGAYIDEVIIPHSWVNCDSNNNRLYVRRFENGFKRSDDILNIDKQSHTLDTLVESFDLAFAIAYESNVFTATKNSQLGTITIAGMGLNEISIFTDEELQTIDDWTGSAYDTLDLKSMNEMLNNMVSNYGPSVSTGLIDLRRHFNLYLSSSTLSNYTVLGPRGECNIVKKTLVTVDYGSTIFDNVVANHDWLNVSKKLIKTLEFRLSDAYGKTVDLRGIPISFSLIFMKLNE